MTISSVLVSCCQLPSIAQFSVAIIPNVESSTLVARKSLQCVVCYYLLCFAVRHIPCGGE